MPGHLPALRRNLLDQPQRLGLLPTYWFWNDRERQRLLLPIVTLAACCVTPLLVVLVVWFELPIWSLLVVGILWPQVLMGLVERRLRAELRRRALSDVPAESPAPSLSSARSGDGVFLALAAFGALGIVGAVVAAWGAVAALWTALGLALLIGGARYSSRRVRQLAERASDPPAIYPGPVGPMLSPDRSRSAGNSAASR